MSALAGTAGVVCGALLGILAGYAGGRLDAIVMRLADVVLAFPQLVLILVVVSMIGGSPMLIVALTGVAWIPGVARVMRGATLALSGREFIQSAEALGYRRSNVLLDELLPNLTAPLLVELGLRISWSIAVIAAASFLGVGVQPPAADWGLMINENRGGVALQPWGVVAPTLCIAIFAIGANLVAEGFSRALLRTGSTV
ncbi:ABC transporter permease [Kribbella speibonae]|nr:ABC transporter permease [Kribbella speibonae]